MAALRINTVHDRDEYLLELAGELDLGAEPELLANLAEAERSDAERIVVDLGGLEFMDSTGIKVLVQAADRWRDSGRLRIRRASEAVRRVLVVAGVESELPFVDE